MKINVTIILSIYACLSLSNISHAQKALPADVVKKIYSILPLADSVKLKAENLVKSGFTAGDGYKEVWIRDLNTFMEIACNVNNREIIKKHLITFFQFQQDDGGILDGYLPTPEGSRDSGGYDYYYSKLAPGLAGHKNTVETDQESSLVQSVAKYIRYTGDNSILNETVSSMTIQKRMEQALQFMLNERFNEEYGLIWGATTVDWGDVQPEHDWGVFLTEDSHIAIDVYDNAMFIIAIEDFLEMANITEQEQSYWSGVKNDLKNNVHKFLWKEDTQKFEPHIYLNGSPFPETFNESEIYYHGGTAVAIEAGLLNKEEVKTAYEKMQENVRLANASSIGLTIYPVYPAGFFKNTGMSPYSYQNGGDWTWFGGRMISQLIRFDLLEEACEALEPMLARVMENNGFYEWYTPDNLPKGSSSFRGSAGVLWSAIDDLQNKIKN